MRYDILGSTDLTTWSHLGTVAITNMNGTAQITPPGGAGPGGRFFRAVSH